MAKRKRKVIMDTRDRGGPVYWEYEDDDATNPDSFTKEDHARLRDLVYDRYPDAKRKNGQASPLDQQVMFHFGITPRGMITIAILIFTIFFLVGQLIQR